MSSPLPSLHSSGRRAWPAMALGLSVALFAALLSPRGAGAEGGDPPQRAGAQAVAGAGDTTVFVDESGARVFRVGDGFELDQYQYADGPIDFSIDVDRTYGPVDEDGHPTAGNVLFGRTGRITLRVFDVDDDYAGTDVAPELDRLVFNGVTVDGFLSGANDQWSVNSFPLDLDLLELPTAANPSGRNDFEVLVDTGNGGALRWAMTVAFAELRVVDDPLPVAMVHGITGATPDPDNSSMEDFGQYGYTLRYSSHYILWSGFKAGRAVDAGRVRPAKLSVGWGSVRTACSSSR